MPRWGESRTEESWWFPKHTPMVKEEETLSTPCDRNGFSDHPYDIAESTRIKFLARDCQVVTGLSEAQAPRSVGIGVLQEFPGRQ